MYIIYPKKFSIKKIKYDTNIENEIYEELNDANSKIQELALKKYGDTFTEDFFYETIALDDSFIKLFNKEINKLLNNQIKIIVKHRSKDLLTNKWIMKQLYLPI
jgi:hypothetical protein